MVNTQPQRVDAVWLRGESIRANSGEQSGSSGWQFHFWSQARCGYKIKQGDGVSGVAQSCCKRSSRMASPETVSSKDVSSRLKAESASRVQNSVCFPSTASAYAGKRGPQNRLPFWASYWQGTWHEGDWWEVLNKYLSTDWDHFESESFFFKKKTNKQQQQQKRKWPLVTLAFKCPNFFIFEEIFPLSLSDWKLLLSSQFILLLPCPSLLLYPEPRCPFSALLNKNFLIVNGPQRRTKFWNYLESWTISTESFSKLIFFF